MNVLQSFKFVALPVPEIIGVLKKFGQSLDYGYSHAPFSPNFSMGFCSDGPCECTMRPNLKSAALPVPEKIAIEVLGVANPIIGEEEAVGGRRWYRSKERW